MSDRSVADRPGSSVEAELVAAGPAGFVSKSDRLATEEPLEIRLRAGGRSKTVAMTMRTPGNDFELAAGFLFCEGAITAISGVAGITYCLENGAEQRYNVVNVDLHAAALPDLGTLERHFATTSACGVCGKASLEALHRHADPVAGPLTVDYATIVSLPDRLRARQRVFEGTGGLHAAALFDAAGRLAVAREDIGRHNALDKAIGWSLMHATVPLSDRVLLVSGRSSYEIVQKAVAAGVPVVCSVSAPSSLAVEMAREFGVTLIGFLRGPTFNVYTHPQRVTFGVR
jgi:FdhD protein